MYIQRNKSKNSKTGKIYTSVLLCSKYREGKKVKTRTVANLSHFPEHIVLGIENMLKSDRETTVSLKDITIKTCIDYGYVYVLLHYIKILRIDQVLEKTLSKSDAALVKAMLVGKIITGGSKLCIYNWLKRETAVCKILGLNMDDYKVDHFYSSLGQMYLEQPKIEKKWFRYHNGSRRRVYLYDLTSTYFEGTQNALGAFGYNRDGKQGKMQMCIGLLTAEDGFPLRIQALPGNTSDSATVVEQICSLKQSLGVDDIVFVGDRGMRIMYHLENDPKLAESNLQFITGLTRAQIETLIARGSIQLSLFSSNLAEVTIDGKRHILSVNPELERKELVWIDNRKKECEALVEKIQEAWNKRRLTNEKNLLKQQESNGKKKYKNLKTEFAQKDIDGYKRRVEKVLKSCGMDKYYSVKVIDNQSFELHFDMNEFQTARSLCGKYVVVTNVDAQEMATAVVRGKYKDLQKVEHAFRDLKSDNISIRPVYHCNENQTKGHVLLCMFAYAIIKELENKLFPFLKEYNQASSNKLSFNDLIAELNNVKMCELKVGTGVTSILFPELNTLQKKIFETLGIDPKVITG
jgi:transposase